MCFMQYCRILQLLEKKEWKGFRTLVSNDKQLRKCGKKLPKHCDVNNDRVISMTEWLNCLHVSYSLTGICFAVL